MALSKEQKEQVSANLRKSIDSLQDAYIDLLHCVDEKEITEFSLELGTIYTAINAINTVNNSITK